MLFQLGTILIFALAGTVTATIITGLLLFQAGRDHFVTSLSFEESMSFASLISATDPVATLSVFSALNVEPGLYSIVYGESVLNDAVAIVLFRTFTAFITEVCVCVCVCDVLFVGRTVGLLKCVLTTARSVSVEPLSARAAETLTHHGC